LVENSTPGSRVATVRLAARAEERHLIGELPGDAQCPRLLLHGQAVPGLDLDCRGALGAHLGDAPADQVPQRRVPGFSGGADRRGDSAAVVPHSAHPRGEFCRTVPGEHQVRMGINEAGEHGAAAEVDSLVRVRGAGGRAHPRHLGLGDDDGGFPQQAKRGPVAHGRIVRDQLADSLDEEGGHRSSLRTVPTASASSAATSPSR
jgi:hypothetical protein